MSGFDYREYTFLGLCNHGHVLGPVTSLLYVIGLVPSSEHGIVQPVAAKRILAWLFDVEEQVESASKLLRRQTEFFSRFFPEQYYPQTPGMLTQGWSPIGALLQNGVEPKVLIREPGVKVVATGIWDPVSVDGETRISDCTTDESLFWSILKEVSSRARDRGMLISIIAKPGWAYESEGGLLPKWDDAEVQKADRILWKRRPND